MSEYLKGYFFVIASSVLFGCMPVMSKFINAGGCNDISLVFYRVTLSLPILYFLAKKENAKTNTKLKISFHEGWKLFLLSLFGITLTPVLMLTSYNYISTGASTTIHFIYPVFVLLGSIIFFKQKNSWVKTLCVVLSTVGVFLFYTPGSEANLTGVVLAFASGITFAIYIVYLPECKLDHIGSFSLCLYLSSMAAAMILVFALATNSLTYNLTPVAWIGAFFFSVALSVFAVIMLQVGIKILGSQRAAILSTLEPIVSITIGIFVFNEIFNIKVAIGVTLILLSVILLTVMDREKTSN